MSGRFVRASSYRHVHGTPAKPDKQYQDLRPLCSGDGNYVAASHKFLAVPVQGGGGPVTVHSLDKPGRIGHAAHKIAVHKGKVIEQCFSPFNYTILATASEDCTAAVTQFPEGGLTEHITKPLAKFHGHEKKVTNLQFHPTASGVLASASADHTVKLWDIEKQAEIKTFDEHKDAMHHISWNTDGSLISSINKDGTCKVFDPRAPTSVTTMDGPKGSKKATVLFADNHNKIITVGSSKSARRTFTVFDAKNTSTPLHTQDIDSAAGVLIAHYDPDNSILYLGGKGDSSIKYFELVDKAPYAHHLSEFRDSKSQKGLCFLPKRACNTKKCEIAVCLRVMRDSIIPVSFQVPRKSDLFQKDLFPDTYAGIPAMTAEEYWAGANKAAVLTSMKPGQGKETSVAKVSVKKSAFELQKDLDKANARIKDLENQLAAALKK